MDGFVAFHEPSPSLTTGPTLFVDQITTAVPGTGCGTALMRKLGALHPHHGVQLHVRRTNSAARAFYAHRCGMREEAWPAYEPFDTHLALSAPPPPPADAKVADAAWRFETYSTWASVPAPTRAWMIVTAHARAPVEYPTPADAEAVLSAAGEDVRNRCLVAVRTRHEGGSPSKSAVEGRGGAREST